MKLNKFLVSAAMVASFGVGAPLSAAVVQIQYTGTAFGVYDTAGVFGAAGSFLNGVAYTANYTFETTNGDTLNYPSVNSAIGGEVYGLTSPALSASLTINGNTISYSGNWFGYIVGSNDGISSRTYQGAAESQTNGLGYRVYVANGINSNSDAIPASFTDSFSYTVTAGDTIEGGFQIFYANSLVLQAEGLLVPDHITFVAPTIQAPIPEPETYAMLLAGLGLLGFAARRRKLKEAAVA